VRAIRESPLRVIFFSKYKKQKREYKRNATNFNNSNNNQNCRGDSRIARFGDKQKDRNELRS
jgi:hypothetical protein